MADAPTCRGSDGRAAEQQCRGGTGKPCESYHQAKGRAHLALKQPGFLDGPRPAGYEVMHKGGAIVLGIGGDNSPWAAGTFYEGVMTAGYASSEADAAVMANIVAAGYAKAETGSAGAGGMVERAVVA